MQMMTLTAWCGLALAQPPAPLRLNDEFLDRYAARYPAGAPLGSGSVMAKYRVVTRGHNGQGRPTIPTDVFLYYAGGRYRCEQHWPPTAGGGRGKRSVTLWAATGTARLAQTDGGEYRIESFDRTPADAPWYDRRFGAASSAAYPLLATHYLVGEDQSAAQFLDWHLLKNKGKYYAAPVVTAVTVGGRRCHRIELNSLELANRRVYCLDAESLLLLAGEVGAQALVEKQTTEYDLSDPARPVAKRITIDTTVAGKPDRTRTWELVERKPWTPPDDEFFTLAAFGLPEPSGDKAVHVPGSPTFQPANAPAGRRWLWPAVLAAAAVLVAAGVVLLLRRRSADAQ